ncbi:MAG: sigma-70 family RNA polymerase sigma factor [Isosphaeraceae bacterium]
MGNDWDEAEQLLPRLRAGDRTPLGELIGRNRARLLRMVALRTDWRLRGRFDPSDVLQEAALDAVRRLDEYLRDPKLPPSLWLRLLVAQRLVTLHRHHLGARARDAGREVSLGRDTLPQASSVALAELLVTGQTSPSQAVLRSERVTRVRDALANLDPLDREVLALRHFEQLSRAETALVLGITEDAGAKRYVRALKRLKDVLTNSPGGLEAV